MLNTKETILKPNLFENFNPDFGIQSPGRINLIGEHTDYNEGFVLPTAINKFIYLYFRKNGSDDLVNLYSETFDSFYNFSLHDYMKSEKGWVNYVLGVINEIQKKNHNLKGFDCLIKSELPIGAGISSSAALECGMAYGLNELFQLGLSKKEMIHISQDAENNYVGSNCGIMDQYASVMSKKNSLLLLDCQTLEEKYIPFDFGDYELLLLNTNVSHNLADSEYNTRREECEKAVSLIKKKYPQVNSLRAINKQMLSNYQPQLPKINYHRCLHVIEENDRVQLATQYLQQNLLKDFGKLMYDSHHSLQYLYEVSCKELDFLVDFSRGEDQILGARMMGGGFGGCTINLIKKDYTKEYIANVSPAYFKEFGIELDAIAVLPHEGTRLL